jgi:hypothetical protein
MSGLAFGPALMARLDQLASFSDEPDRLTRLYCRRRIAAPWVRSRPG